MYSMLSMTLYWSVIFSSCSCRIWGLSASSSIWYLPFYWICMYFPVSKHGFIWFRSTSMFGWLSASRF